MLTFSLFIFGTKFAYNKLQKTIRRGKYNEKILVDNIYVDSTSFKCVPG